jgi:hypothetical protein
MLPRRKPAARRGDAPPTLPAVYPWHASDARVTQDGRRAPG